MRLGASASTECISWRRPMEDIYSLLGSSSDKWTSWLSHRHLGGKGWTDVISLPCPLPPSRRHYRFRTPRHAPRLASSSSCGDTTFCPAPDRKHLLNSSATSRSRR